MRKVKVHPLLKKVMKASEEKKQDARWTGRFRKKLAALPPRIWKLGGAAFLVLVIGWCMLAPDQKETTRTPLTPGAAGTGVTATGQSPASAVPSGAAIPENELIFIQSVRLQPSQPTRMDSLKAEVVAAPDAPERLIYSYQWRVNDQVLAEEKGAAMNLSPFKKGDLITVTVTPSNGDIQGHAVESPVVSLHSVQPTLELKAGRLARKAGEPVVLQLSGAAPDGGQVTFSLAPPLVEGMTIDVRSGKISWLPPPSQKGAVRFGVSVEDDQQTKVTQVFEFTLE